MEINGFSPVAQMSAQDSSSLKRRMSRDEESTIQAKELRPTPPSPPPVRLPRVQPAVKIEKGIFEQNELIQGFRLINDDYTFIGTTNYFDNRFSLTNDSGEKIEFHEVWLLTSDQPQLRLVQGKEGVFFFYQGSPLEVLLKLGQIEGLGHCLSRIFLHENNNIGLKIFVEFLQTRNSNGEMLISKLAKDSLDAILVLAEADQISVAISDLALQTM